MLDPFKKSLELLDPIPVEEGPDKVCSLPEAIGRLVRPGMNLHLCTTHNRPGAVLIELIRAFSGQSPDFTLSCIGFVANGVAPVHAGITNKIIGTFIGDSYPTPAPNPVITRAWKEGRIQIESWSILSFTLRLMAGAMGVPFLPTRSLVGSTMALDNHENFTEIEDESGERFGLVKALIPDLAFIHAAWADKSGNTILTPPYGEEAFGAWAAKDGVIVTVDRVVSSETIRQNSHLCKIPSYMVRAVCPTPFGAHPGGVSNRGLPEFEAYADDYDFIEDVRKASKTEETMSAWIKEWVDECPTWDDYLEKLGEGRIRALKEKAHPDSWKAELSGLSADIPEGPEFSPVEMMVVAAGRVLAGRMKDNGLTTILAGVGTSNLAAWLGYYQLKQEGVEAELMAEIGFYGYAPRPADPFIFNYRNMPASKMLTGIPTIMGVFMGGAANRCIGSIGAAQVDMHGNVNTTLIPDVTYLTGSGGGNDICSAASQVMVTAYSGKKRYVEKVDYVTSPGNRVRTVVSELGVLEKDGSGELILTSFFPETGKTMDEIIARIKDRCGWNLKVAPEPRPIDPPTLDELKLLRILDPKRQFLGKR